MEQKTDVGTSFINDTKEFEKRLDLLLKVTNNSNLIHDAREYEKYLDCLIKTNKCKRKACRSIFAHLTEMSYCLNLEEKCISNYETYLTNKTKNKV